MKRRGFHSLFSSVFLSQFVCLCFSLSLSCLLSTSWKGRWPLYQLYIQPDVQLHEAVFIQHQEQAGVTGGLW